MKTNELDNLSRDKLFEVLKDKCKKRAKTHFWVGLVSLILLILFLIMVTIAINFEHSTSYSAQDKEGFDFVYLLTLFLWALMSGWWVLKSHSFLKNIDGLGTPEQLLNKFKKYVKDKSDILTIANLIFCGWFACFLYTADLDIIFKVVGWVVILACATVGVYRLIRGKYFMGSSDEDITRRLGLPPTPS